MLSLCPSGNPGPNPSQVLSLNPGFNPWDSSLSTQLLRDNDDDGDEDEECRDNNNDNNDDNGDGDNNYELMRLRKTRKNEAKLASLGVESATMAWVLPLRLDKRLF